MATEIIQTEFGTMIVKDGIAYQLMTNNLTDPSQPFEVKVVGSSVTLEVHLDPSNDAVEIYGSDDGGTTQRVIKTLADGTMAADPAIANQTTLALVAARLLNGTDSAAKLLADVLAKMIAAPATEAKQDIGNGSLATIAGKDFATQATLAAILAKIIDAPATAANQTSAISLLTPPNSYLTIPVSVAANATLGALLTAYNGTIFPSESPYPAGLVGIRLLPKVSGIYMANDGTDASNSSNPMIYGVQKTYLGNAATFADFKFYAAEASVLSVDLMMVE